jgi:hypothetical protein
VTSSGSGCQVNGPPAARGEIALADAVNGVRLAGARRKVLSVAADLVIQGLDSAIASRRVTHDFARQMDGATEIRCSEFGANLVAHMK